MKQPRWARPSGAAPAWSETFSAQTSLGVMAPRADEPRPDPGRGSLLSVVVLASADGATHRAEDPQDDANDHKEVADGLQDREARYEPAEDDQDDSESDHRGFLSCCVSCPQGQWTRKVADEPRQRNGRAPHSSSAGQELMRRFGVRFG